MCSKILLTKQCHQIIGNDWEKRKLWAIHPKKHLTNILKEFQFCIPGLASYQNFRLHLNLQLNKKGFLCHICDTIFYKTSFLYIVIIEAFANQEGIFNRRRKKLFVFIKTHKFKCQPHISSSFNTDFTFDQEIALTIIYTYCIYVPSKEVE